MHRWLLAAIFVLLGMPALAAGPQDGPGCIGATFAECVGWLRGTMRLDEGLLQRSANTSREMVDVNGRHLGGVVPVYAQLPNGTETFVILLHIQPDGRIQWVQTSLRHNLMEARTEAAYDRSGFYDMVWRLLGRRCAGIAKFDMYRFFENTVKPRVKEERQDLAKGLFGFHRVVSRVTNIPFCGGTIGYTNQVEWRGSNNPEAGRSPTSFSEIELH